MNENLNLVEILKDASPGTKLWSSICGECELTRVVTTNTTAYPIECSTKNYQGRLESVVFTVNGEYTSQFEEGECVLFPSKDNRDWSTFKISKPHKHFEPYQKVLVKEYCNDKFIWIPELYGYYNTSSKTHFLVGYELTVSEEEDIIPYSGNEDKLGKPVK